MVRRLFLISYMHHLADSILAANQMAQQMGPMGPAAGANPFQPGQDPHKMYLNEAENLEVFEHFCILDGVEERVLRKYGAAQ